MKSYESFQIGYYYRLYACCTDAETLEWIIAEVKRLVPTCKVTAADFAGKKWSIDIEKLQDQDVHIMWWIMGQLGQRGWEPFAVTEDATRSLVSGIYHFRREVVAN